MTWAVAIVGGIALTGTALNTYEQNRRAESQRKEAEKAYNKVYGGSPILSEETALDQRDWRADKPNQTAEVPQTVQTPQIPQTTQTIDALGDSNIVSETSQPMSSDMFRNLTDSLTAKDQPGPTSYTVTQAPTGGFAYKIDGNQQQNQAPLQSQSTTTSQVGATNDFMKLYGE